MLDERPAALASLRFTYLFWYLLNPLISKWNILKWKFKLELFHNPKIFIEIHWAVSEPIRVNFLDGQKFQKRLFIITHRINIIFESETYTTDTSILLLVSIVQIDVGRKTFLHLFLRKKGIIEIRTKPDWGEHIDT